MSAGSSQPARGAVPGTVRKIMGLLSPAERKRGLLLTLMVIVMALLETAGVASVMPFLAVLANPEVVQEQALLRGVYEGLAFQSVDSFLVALGLVVFFVVVLGAVFRVVTKHALNRFTEMRRHTISARLLETYLRQPYTFFLQRHTGDMAKSVLSEVDQLVGNVFRPAFHVLAYSIVVLALVAFIVAVDPALAAVVALVIGGAYGVIFMLVRGILGRMGEDRVVANRERFQAAQDALSGIKDIKLLGREYAYLSRFLPSSVRFAQHQATKTTLSEVPKYLIEALGFGGVIILTLVLMARRETLAEVLPLLGLYAFAGYRLLPAAQYIYAGLARLRFGIAAVDEVYAVLAQRERLAEIRERSIEPLVPSRTVSLERISFTYPESREPALSGIDLHIPVGSAIGVVGSTGAGKTTVIDILLGLIAPTSGALLVDGVRIDGSNLRSWQAALGYVPQDIFLTDGTIAENIALGVPREKIDISAVERAARIAQIHQFVTTGLPAGYDTSIGERGVRLSGGQRQRIGIARALYHDPAVLVLDEATSALDTVSERALMDAVGALHGAKTIILIAHRLSTVQACDRIFLLEAGRVRAVGSYQELMQDDDRFRALAGGQALPIREGVTPDVRSLAKHDPS